MSETICNPQTLLYNGAPVSDANPLPCSSAAATQAAISTAPLNPVTWLINGALVSDTNPVPITLAAAALSATTWDPANKSAHALLSNGNLTATGDGTVSNFIGFATSSISGTQKIYFEASADVLVLTSPGFGLANVSESLASFLGATANSIGYFTNGQVFFNNALLTTIATYTAGNIIGQAVDFALGKVWWRVGAGNWNNDVIANQNPATGTGGITIGVAGTIFPAYNLDTNAATTANFGSAFANAAPAGFTYLP